MTSFKKDKSPEMNSYTHLSAVWECWTQSQRREPLTLFTIYFSSISLVFIEEHTLIHTNINKHFTDHHFRFIEYHTHLIYRFIYYKWGSLNIFNRFHWTLSWFHLWVETVNEKRVNVSSVYQWWFTYISYSEH